MGQAIRDALTGFSYPLRAVPYLFRHRLFLLTGLCLAVHLVLVAAVLVPVLWYVWPLLGDLQKHLVSLGEGHAWLMKILAGLGYFIRLIGLLLVFLATGVLVLVAGRVAAGPFLDLLSERVEELETGVPAAAFSAARLGRGLILALKDLAPNLLILVGFQALVWLFGLIPVVGTLGAPVLAAAGTSIFLAHEFMGLVLLRRFVPYFPRWGFVMGHKALAAGFGASCLVLMAVPFLNLALLPLCAVGGTFAVCRVDAGRREGHPRPASTV
ncbi:MAG: EI24 domain-containing protein [Spirochaetes bacterium]|nr:EI24 domain-containing protein [Spirochaetota bacterium]